MIPVYVISLKSAIARRTAISRQLDSLGVAYEIKDAVDGASLDLSQLPLPLDDQEFSRKNGKRLVKGEIGCYLSHYNLWRSIVTQDIPYAVILEDDAVLEDDFPEIINALPNIGWQWDVIRLSSYGVSHDLLRKKYGDPPDICRRRAWRRVLHKLSPIGHGRFLVRYKRPVYDTACYMISCHAARVLLSHCDTMQHPIDVLYEQSWIHHLYFLGVHFPVVHQARMTSAESPNDSVLEIERIRHMASTGRINVSERIRQWWIRRRERYSCYWWNLTHPPKKT